MADPRAIELEAISRYEKKIENLWKGFTNKFGPLDETLDLTVRPSITTDQIGGLAKAKREIEGFNCFLRDPSLYNHWGIEPTRGIILYGPPGTGKTLLANLLATLSESVFFKLVIPNLILLSFKLGNTMGDFLKEFFAVVDACRRRVIFFDDIDFLDSDALVFLRGSEELHARIYNAIIDLTDRLIRLGETIIVASTANPSNIKPQLIKRGRFERLIEVPLPKDDERIEIFEIHKRRAESIAKRTLFDKWDYSALINQARDLNGSDIAEIVRRTLEEKARLEASGIKPTLVITEDIIQEMASYEKIRQLKSKIKYGDSQYI